MASGVYAITNTANNKQYIGSALNFDKRWREHTNSLKRGDHRSISLLRAWEKYGADVFRFRKLLICAPKNLLMYEQICIDGLASEYNILRVAGSFLGVRWSDERKAQSSAQRKAMPRSPGQLQHLANLADRARGKPGRKPSDEERAKIAASLTGQKQSEESKRKKSEATKGRQKSEEHKAKIGALAIEVRRERRFPQSGAPSFRRRVVAKHTRPNQSSA